MKRLFKNFLKNEPLKLVLGISLFLPGLILDYLGYESISLGIFITALAVSGIAVFIDAVKGIIRLDFLDEKFLMMIAAIGAMIIGEAEEGVAVMLFYLLGEWFEHIAVRRSRRSIKSLMEIRPDTANVIRDGVEVTEDAEDVEVGETIIVRSGERVPIDSLVLEGSCDIDTSALTGESVPLGVTVGDRVDSGVVVIGGVITCRTLRAADESRAARVLELVENASERKSREENFITKFSRIYTPVVTLLAVFMAILPPLLGLLSWQAAIYRALSFLVVSCPCALVISVPMAFFGGIGAAAAEGILYKGGNTFSPISGAKRVIFDKTGTLTTGELRVGRVLAIDMSESELISLAASAEYGSRHPIAECLKSTAKEIYTATEVREIAGKGVLANIDGRVIAVGNRLLMSDVGAFIPSDTPDSAVCVAAEGVYCGCISFEDTPRPEAKEAVEALHSLGVKRTYILSGDRKAVAEKVGRRLGIDEVYAELLPEDKYRLLEDIIKEGEKTVYVGDGINDAPCLARADVGIAMGGIGSDSAIEAADAVIMSDNLSRIPAAMRIARRTLRIAKENIIFAIGVKLLVLALVSALGANMWLAVFADVGVAVLAILNSMRMLVRRRPTCRIANR